MSILELQKTKCYHCGNACEEAVLVLEEKNFCCTGCKSVYQLLSANDLCEYYDIDKNPGLEIKDIDYSKYNYLDNEELLSEILDFQNDKYATVTLYLPQIHCYSCLWLLEMFNQLHTGITKSKVNYLKKELSVSFLKSETTLKEIATKLASIGYAPIIEKKNGKQAQGSKTNKKLLYELGIAGFCFGNIMFLSFPEYFSIKGSIDKSILNYLGFVNLLLGTILLVFSGKSFFLSAFQSLKHKKINLDVPISLGIISLFFYSTYEILLQVGIGYFDSLSGLIFFLLLGRLFQNKTFEQFNFERDYTSYFPLSTTLLTKNGQTSIPLNQLKIGDRILIQNEEIIPSDGVLLNDSASIDYSFVTGESYPETIAKNQNICAGGRNKGQNIEILVSALPSQSYLTKLWSESSEQQSTKISSLSDALGTWFTIGVLILAFGSAAYWQYYDPSKVLKVFTSVLIVACPCALALAIPISYGNTLRIFGNMGFYLKHANIVELLSKIDQIIFDKTGTLTITNQGQVRFFGIMSEAQKQKVASVIQHSTHPLSKAIYSFLDEKRLLKISDFKEFPGQGIQGFINNDLIQIGSAKWILEDEEISNSSEVFIKINDAIIGNFKIENKYRANLSELFKRLSSKYKLSILSGDKDSEKGNLKNLAPELDLHFNQSPFDKKKFIEKLNEKGVKPLMIGDGLNDAGALHSALVGIAITENSANFTPSSDVILNAENIQNLPFFLSFSQKTIYVVYACFGLSFLYNFVGLYFAIQGRLSPLVSAILMPVSSVSVLFLSLGLTWLIKKRT